jgi:hypothetical protein
MADGRRGTSSLTRCDKDDGHKMSSADRDQPNEPDLDSESFPRIDGSCARRAWGVVVLLCRLSCDPPGYRGLRTSSPSNPACLSEPSRPATSLPVIHTSWPSQPATSLFVPRASRPFAFDDNPDLVSNQRGWLSGSCQLLVESVPLSAFEGTVTLPLALWRINCRANPPDALSDCRRPRGARLTRKR